MKKNPSKEIKSQYSNIYLLGIKIYLFLSFIEGINKNIENGIISENESFTEIIKFLEKTETTTNKNTGIETTEPSILSLITKKIETEKNQHNAHSFDFKFLEKIEKIKQPLPEITPKKDSQPPSSPKSNS